MKKPWTFGRRFRWFWLISLAIAYPLELNAALHASVIHGGAKLVVGFIIGTPIVLAILVALILGVRDLVNGIFSDMSFSNSDPLTPAQARLIAFQELGREPTDGEIIQVQSYYENLKSQARTRAVTKGALLGGALWYGNRNRDSFL